jgi:hypothetical protein
MRTNALPKPSKRAHKEAARITVLPTPPITETTRIHLVLFGMQNRTFGPYLAAIERILVSAMLGLGFAVWNWPQGLGFAVWKAPGRSLTWSIAQRAERGFWQQPRPQVP